MSPCEYKTKSKRGGVCCSNRGNKDKTYKIWTRDNLLYPMTYHVKLEKKTGIPSQAVDTSEKLPELSKKRV